ncbi:aspartic proteinase-like protein 2 [Ipomoea triloba]|uniref:aspartic proteinase-like protein 2 n=1 Tax=Ipomoea triloba TaxID=35885 RepID=UPI00125E5330|nr:aspartic proteinase-like protein 2 [Ipomoea triloba]
MVDLRWFLAVLVLWAAFVEGNNNLVFKVKHKYGGRGSSVLRELRAHDSFRHRRMLAAVDFQLGGNGQPTDAALYYTKLAIGTPSKNYYVQVDTGSDILWVNCAGCYKCPKKSNLGIALSLYDMKSSSTAKEVTCDQDFCTTMFNAPYSDCKVGMPCEYQITYGDGSRTAGYFVQDYIHFDQVTGNLQTKSMNGSIAFGCSGQQSGELGTSAEAVDGIIGFGQANSSLISQLAASGKVKKIFSHCLDTENSGGIFAIGQVVQPKVATTPLVPDEPHYNVIMKSIEVDGAPLDIPTYTFDTGSSKGTIVDSGTTLAYLPDTIYDPLMNKMMSKQSSLKIHLVDEQFKCFYYNQNVDNGFPVITFVFQNSLKLTVHPHEYLFEVQDGEWCIGWQNSGMQTKDGKEITLLGDLVLSGKLVVYDLENQTIGWTDHNCSSSIKVKDESSGNVYTVGAHDISSANAQNTGNLFMLLIFILLMM